jgi:hypothetical protein
LKQTDVGYVVSRGPTLQVVQNGFADELFQQLDTVEPVPECDDELRRFAGSVGCDAGRERMAR